MVKPNKIVWTLFLLAWTGMLLFMALRIHTQISPTVKGGLNELMYGAFAIGMLCLTMLVAMVIPRFSKKPVFFWGFFTVYVLTIAGLRRTEFDFFLMLLIVLWLGSIVFFGAIWCASGRASNMTRVFMLASGGVLSIGALSYLIFGIDIDFFSGRIAFGYENPNYFAQFVLIGVFSYFLLHAITEGKSSGYLGAIATGIIVAGAVVILLLANSRNALVALTVFLAVYFIRGLWARIFVMTAALMFGMIALEGADLNEISSSRLRLWNIHFQHVLQEGLTSMLFGVVEYPPSWIIHAYSALHEVETTSFKKYRVDNAYLELFVEWGFLGISALALGVLSTWRQSFRLSGNVGRVWRSILVAVLAQGLFVANFFSFFAPVALFATFFFGLPWYFQERCGAPVKNDARSQNSGGIPVSAHTGRRGKFRPAVRRIYRL